MDGNWSSLPGDILYMIAKLLRTNKFDIFRARAVCSWWRASIPASKTSPFQLCLTIDINGSNIPPLVLKQKTTLVVSPANIIDIDINSSNSSWIIQVVETSHKKLSILNPFLNTPKNKSYFPKSDELPDHLNLVDVKISVIDTSYDVCVTDSFGLETIVSNKAIVKVVTSTSVEDGEEKYKVIFVFKGDVLVWETGKKTTKIEDFEGVRDIALHKDKLYAVFRLGLVTVFDIDTCSVVLGYGQSQHGRVVLGRIYCLAEFKEKLYLVGYDREYCNYTATTRYKRVEVNVLNDPLNDEKLTLRNCSSDFKSRFFSCDTENAIWKYTSDFEGGIFYVFNNTVMCAVSSEYFGKRRGNKLYIDGVVSRPNQTSYTKPALSKMIHQTPFWPPPQWILLRKKQTPSALALYLEPYLRDKKCIELLTKLVQ